jgi:uncharacterized membrane protein YdjX (TVP38/TMEM64 family)
MPARSAYIKLAVFAAVVAGAFAVARAAGLAEYTDVQALAGAVRRARDVPWAPVLFVLAYVLLTTVGLPGSALTLAGGAIFGFWLGTALNWLGATLGATCAFLLARLLGQDAVGRLLGRHAARLDRAAAQHGFAALLRLRLLPVVPFNALNFGAAFARVPLRPYVAATALGIIPGTAVYTYFADAVLSGAEGARRQALVRVAVAGALLILLSFTPAVARRLGWIGGAGPAEEPN